MAAVATPSPAPPLQDRALPDMSRLLGKKFAGVINTPATADIALTLREWIASLKGYLEFAQTIATHMDKSTENNPSGTSGERLVLIGEFTEYEYLFVSGLLGTNASYRELADIFTELKNLKANLQQSNLLVKTRFDISWSSKRIVFRIALFRSRNPSQFKNGLLANVAVTQARNELLQFFSLFNGHMKSISERMGALEKETSQNNMDNRTTASTQDQFRQVLQQLDEEQDLRSATQANQRYTITISVTLGDDPKAFFKTLESPI
ncbi:hypothetical protein RhiJN_27587 [Ceratobasidium sp. AG-Ba]|nr:hypothetical protein RhiJN_13531 [Ceratobasidium sp. AG-Ba]QRV99568.1 hypothetical protein RhiJN_27587 [Ceratobasidium sp. AG-Ba]QRW14090.1 hypothetical protein RhiLY_13089 [Ceratobasidium sp. AG-Ba]